MQNCAVVPKPSKFELLNSGNKPMDVVVFADDTKSESKDRILRINRFERVITTFVNEDNVIGEQSDCLSWSY